MDDDYIVRADREDADCEAEGRGKTGFAVHISDDPAEGSISIS
jgi:hypothetical protein